MIYLSRVRAISQQCFLAMIVASLVSASFGRFANAEQQGSPPEATPPVTTPLAATPTLAKSEPLSFRLKWLVYSSFAHHFVALEKGFYSAEGLDVTIRPGGAGLDPIKLVASGQDTVGLAGYAQILLARQQDIPVVAIAEEYIKNGAVAMALQSSGISRPEDFVGKTVGVIPGSDTGTVYAALMEKLGIDRKQVKEVVVSFDLSPFFQRKIDVTTAAFITNQVIVAQHKGFPVNVIDPVKYGIDPGGNVFFVAEASLRDAAKRNQIKRFLRASFKGIVESQKLPTSEVVGYVLKHNVQLDQVTESDIWEATKNQLLAKDPKSVGYMDPNKWKHTAELFHKYSGLKSTEGTSKSFTNTLVEEIQAESKIKH